MTTINGTASIRSGHGLLRDLQSIRQRTRQRIEDGAAAPPGAADHDVPQRLNDTMIAQIVGAMRNRRGLLVSAIKRELPSLAHSDAQGSATRCPADLINRRALERMIREDLVAERIAIECCREMIRRMGGRDDGTLRLLEGIFAMQEEHEEHAEELSGMLDELHRLATGGMKDTFQQLRSVSRRRDHV